MDRTLRRQRWRRRGLLVAAPPETAWARTHAALPAVAAADSGWDLYLSARDEAGRAMVARQPLERRDGGLVAGAPQRRPALGLGALGAFDDSGVTLSCIVDDGDRRLMYYSGWTRGVSVPFYFYVGLAVSDDGGRTFERASRGPILERNDVDPFLTASPSVLVEGGTWRMWYVSATEWRIVDGAPAHRYHVRYAESADGTRWRRDGHVCIDYRGDDEYAIGRPFVMRDDGRYRMWFCARGDAYRLGYAESDDGLSWERDDAAVSLTGEPEAWEREMTAYPHVFADGDARHMLYNGNGYGSTGIGWATLEKEDA
jgi:hypothetical protein